MPAKRLPQHFYATFGIKYRTEPHPTLPPEIAHPEKVIEIWAPTRTIARALITGLTLVLDDAIAYYGDLYDWPTTLTEDEEFAKYYPGGVSMIIDCRELSGEQTVDGLHLFADPEPDEGGPHD